MGSGSVVARERQQPQNKFTLLLISILALSLLNLFMPDTGLRPVLFEVVVLTVIVAGARAVSTSRRGLVLMLVFALPAIVLTGLMSVISVPLLNPIRSGFIALLLIYMAVNVFRSVLADREVTTDTIMGSICAYLLIGICWSFLYTLAELIQPGSFSLPELTSGQAGYALREQASMMLYFSFVTLTTLGYGDIVPLTSSARSLCWMEAVLGQMYIAVLVARLVGIHIARTRSD